MRRMVHAAKSRPCADCGGTFPFYVMDLDHRDPATKKFTIGDYLGKRGTLTALASEIAKCDPVCSNCHRSRSYLRKHHLLGKR